MYNDDFLLKFYLLNSGTPIQRIYSGFRFQLSQDVSLTSGQDHYTHRTLAVLSTLLMLRHFGNRVPQQTQSVTLPTYLHTINFSIGQV
jgi:hypothetical protein